MSANETSTVDPARTFLRWHLLGGRPIIEHAEDAARVFAENPGELFRTSELLAIAELTERLSLSGDTVPDPQTIFSRRKRLEELLTPRSFFYGLPGQHSNFTDFRLYVPIPVRAMEPGKLRQNAQRPRSRYAELTELLQDLDNNRIDHGVLLFGESGAGKTVATIKATHDCIFADAALEQVSAPLAGFLPCRIKTDMDLLPAKDTLEHLLIATSRLPHTDANVNRVREYLRWSKLLVLCDLNSVTKNREQVVDALRSLQQRVKDQKSNGYPQHRVVITYRSTRQDDGLLTRLMKDDLFQKYEMEPLNAFQASGYIQNLGHVEASICDNLRISAPIRNITVDVQLVRNLSGRFTPNGKPLISIPLLMHFVSILPESQRNEVQHTADLYDRVVEQLLQRNEHLYPERLPEPLLGEEGRTVLRALMTRIALSILSQSADAVLLTRDQCRKILARPDQYAEQQRLWPHSDSDDDAWWQPENSRYYSNFDPLPAERVVWPRELLNAVMEFGLLRREGNQIGFLHDSFLYYFAGAIALWDRGIPELDAGPASKIDAWADAVAARIQTDPETWRLPCEFLSGRLSARTAREIVERLIVADPLPGLTRLIQTLTQLHRSASSTSTGAESGVSASDSSWPDAKILHIVDWTTRRHGAWLHANPKQLMHSCVYDLQWWDAYRESELRRYVDNRLRPRMERCDRDWPECLHGGRVSRVLTMSDHTQGIYCTTVFRDKSGLVLVVSGSGDGTVKVWNPKTGDVRTMCEHNEPVSSVAVVEGPDGRLLIASGSWDNTVKVWVWEPDHDPQPGDVRTMREHSDYVSDVEAVQLPAGRPLIVSCSLDKTVKAWAWDPDHDPKPGDIRTMREHADEIVCLAVVVGPDVRPLIASGSRDNTVKVWVWDSDHDPQTGDVRTLCEHEDWVCCVVIAEGPDRRPLIVSGSYGEVKVWAWDPNHDPQPENVRNMREQHGWVNGVAVENGANDRLIIVSGGEDNTVRVWAWNPDHDPQPDSVCTFSEHTGNIVCVDVALEPEGSPVIVSGSDDGTVKAWEWNPDYAHQPGCVPDFSKHAKGVTCVAFAHLSDGRSLVVSGSGDGTVKVWNPKTGDVRTMCEHNEPVSSVAVVEGPDGRLLIASGSWDNTVKVWVWEPDHDPQPGDVRTMREHSDYVSDVEAVQLPAGRPLIVSCSLDKTVKAWAWDPDHDPKPGDVRTMREHSDSVYCVAIGEGQDGVTMIVSGGEDKTVKVWAWEPEYDRHQINVRTMREHDDPVHSVTVVKGLDGRPMIVSGTWEKNVWMWEADRDPLPGDVRPMLNRDEEVYGAAIVERVDGQSLIVAAASWHRFFKVWDWIPDHDPQLRYVQNMDAHNGHENCVAILTPPDRPPLIVSGGDDGRAIIWQPQLLSTTEQTAPVDPLVLVLDSAVACVATASTAASPSVRTPNDSHPWFVAGLNDGRVVIVRVHCSKSE